MASPPLIADQGGKARLQSSIDAKSGTENVTSARHNWDLFNFPLTLLQRHQKRRDGPLTRDQGDGSESGAPLSNQNTPSSISAHSRPASKEASFLGGGGSTSSAPSAAVHRFALLMTDSEPMPPGRSLECLSHSSEFVFHCPQELLHPTEGLVEYASQYNSLGPRAAKEKPRLCARYFEACRELMGFVAESPPVVAEKSRIATPKQKKDGLAAASPVATLDEQQQEQEPPHDASVAFPIETVILAAVNARVGASDAFVAPDLCCGLLRVTPRKGHKEAEEPTPLAPEVYEEARRRADLPAYRWSRDDVCPLGNLCRDIHPFILRPADATASANNTTTCRSASNSNNNNTINTAASAAGASTTDNASSIVDDRDSLELTAGGDDETVNPLPRCLIHPRISVVRTHMRDEKGMALAPYPTLADLNNLNAGEKEKEAMPTFDIALPNVYTLHMSAVPCSRIFITRGAVAHLKMLQRRAAAEGQQQQQPAEPNALIMQLCAHYSKNAMCCRGNECNFVHLQDCVIDSDAVSKQKAKDERETRLLQMKAITVAKINMLAASAAAAAANQQQLQQQSAAARRLQSGMSHDGHRAHHGSPHTPSGSLLPSPQLRHTQSPHTSYAMGASGSGSMMFAPPVPAASALQLLPQMPPSIAGMPPSPGGGMSMPAPNMNPSGDQHTMAMAQQYAAYHQQAAYAHQMQQQAQAAATAAAVAHQQMMMLSSSQPPLPPPQQQQHVPSQLPSAFYTGQPPAMAPPMPTFAPVPVPPLMGTAMGAQMPTPQHSPALLSNMSDNSRNYSPGHSLGNNTPMYSQPTTAQTFGGMPAQAAQYSPSNTGMFAMAPQQHVGWGPSYLSGPQAPAPMVAPVSQPYIQPPQQFAPNPMPAWPHGMQPNYRM